MPFYFGAMFPSQLFSSSVTLLMRCSCGLILMGILRSLIFIDYVLYICVDYNAGIDRVLRQLADNVVRRLGTFLES